MSDDELLSRVEDGVLWLTINRADKGNAIPYYVRDALTSAFQDAHHDLAIRAVVLTAAGERHFCTGADLTVPQPVRYEKPEGAPDRAVGTATNMMRGGFQRLMQSIQDCEKPVIVALNGTAAGGGSMLVLAADLVIAADNARLIQVFVRRGLIPDGGVAYLLPRIVGMHKAKELIFFGDDLSAADAERLGIVNKVVPAAEFDAAVAEWAGKLASKSPLIMRLGKDAMFRQLDMPFLEALDYLRSQLSLAMSTEDIVEGVSAFFEKREPQWKGR